MIFDGKGLAVVLGILWLIGAVVGVTLKAFGLVGWHGVAWLAFGPPVALVICGFVIVCSAAWSRRGY